MCHQLSFWYKALDLKIPSKVTMTGGIYLWKDGREVPDTMNVALEHPEEILFSWDSGFGNSALGATEDILGTDGTISKGAQIRYRPQKINRPDGTEIVATTASPLAHMQNFFDSVRKGRRRTARSTRVPRVDRVPDGGRELPPRTHHHLGSRKRRDRVSRKRCIRPPQRCVVLARQADAAARL